MNVEAAKLEDKAGQALRRILVHVSDAILLSEKKYPCDINMELTNSWS
jgi:hypothetical protein